MKILGSVLLLFILNTSQKLNYRIDPQASSIGWTGHAQAGAYSPTGTLKVSSGLLTLTDGKLLSGRISVDMSSLQTANDEMKTHLRGTDFFDVEKFPTAVFELTTVKGNIASGQLTIKGITKPISFPFKLSGTNLDASLTIDRTLYGIKYNSASYFQDLGSYAIKNEFELLVHLQYVAF